VNELTLSRRRRVPSHIKTHSGQKRRPRNSWPVNRSQDWPVIHVTHAGPTIDSGRPVNQKLATQCTGWFKNTNHHTEWIRKHTNCHTGTAPSLLDYPLLTQKRVKLDRLQIWQVHSWDPSEQKPIKILEKRERGRIHGLPKFLGHPLLSQERKNLRTSHFVLLFSGSNGTKGHEKFQENSHGCTKGQGHHLRGERGRQLPAPRPKQKNNM